MLEWTEGEHVLLYIADFKKKKRKKKEGIDILKLICFIKLLIILYGFG